MKKVFYSLRDKGYIQLIKGQNYWIKTAKFGEETAKLSSCSLYWRNNLVFKIHTNNIKKAEFCSASNETTLLKSFIPPKIDSYYFLNQTI